MSENLIEIRDLHFSRGNKDIFCGVNMDIKPGEITAIMGPSGTGKTTLLKLIAGQLKPNQGTIHVAGENVHELSRKALYQLRKKMGMLFQSGALLTDLSVYDNIAFPLREHTPLSEDLIRSIVLMKLQAVGLRGAAHYMPSALSGGMSRRAALARALVMDPTLIMYDEPFTGQDPISMGVLVKLIKETTQALNLTGIVVSHDVQETLSIADHVVILSNGVVVESGSEQAIKQSDSAWVKQFVDGEADGPVPFHLAAESLENEFLTQGVK